MKRWLFLAVLVLLVPSLAGHHVPEGEHPVTDPGAEFRVSMPDGPFAPRAEMFELTEGWAFPAGLQWTQQLSSTLAPTACDSGATVTWRIHVPATNEPDGCQIAGETQWTVAYTGMVAGFRGNGQVTALSNAQLRQVLGADNSATTWAEVDQSWPRDEVDICIPDDPRFRAWLEEGFPSGEVGGPSGVTLRSDGALRVVDPDETTMAFCGGPWTLLVMPARFIEDDDVQPVMLDSVTQPFGSEDPYRWRVSVAVADTASNAYDYLHMLLDPAIQAGLDAKVWGPNDPDDPTQEALGLPPRPWIQFDYRDDEATGRFTTNGDGPYELRMRGASNNCGSDIGLRTTLRADDDAATTVDWLPCDIWPETTGTPSSIQDFSVGIVPLPGLQSGTYTVSITRATGDWNDQEAWFYVEPSPAGASTTQVERSGSGSHSPPGRLDWALATQGSPVSGPAPSDPPESGDASVGEDGPSDGDDPGSASGGQGSHGAVPGASVGRQRPDVSPGEWNDETRDAAIETGAVVGIGAAAFVIVQVVANAVGASMGAAGGAGASVGSTAGQGARAASLAAAGEAGQEAGIAYGEEQLRARAHAGETRRRFMWPWFAYLLAVVLLGIFFAIEAADGPLADIWRGWLDAIVPVGIAAAIFFALHFFLEWTMAHASGVKARFRFLLAGAVALAASTLVLRTAFGYPGYVHEEEGGGPGRTLRGLRSVGVLGAMLALVAPFLGVAGLSSDVANAGVTVALIALVSASIPVKPMPAADIWRWNPALAVLVPILAFGLFFLDAIGWVSRDAYWALSAIGALLYLGVTITQLVATAQRRKRPPAWPATPNGGSPPPGPPISKGPAP